MARFKVALWQDGPDVKMQVLEMDEDLRGKDLILSHDGIMVRSVYVPALNCANVFLRGSGDKCDGDVVTGVGVDIERVRAALIAAGGEVVGKPGEVGEQTPQPGCPPAPTPETTTYGLDVQLVDGTTVLSVELKLTHAQYAALVRYVAALI